ncbi:hypothetical protein K490DRAFT_54424 [Saccharata proteae CBS 121410]|uniref:Uncharacterized protein n=1 Tax=Saccharata proteae CBS 121410 TaxID=1314787 RepID=A0A9P4HY37_9PEZI|nr:hypothetical protein K490DRAFT_54424 [Saccharata proteae CBS 121410]
MLVSTILAPLGAVLLQAALASGQACFDAGWAPNGQCNSDPNTPERLQANLIQDQAVANCSAAGVFTAVVKYMDLLGSTRWVSAMAAPTINPSFTGTIPFQFRVAQSTMAAGPVTFSLIGSNTGGQFTTRQVKSFTYNQAHATTLTVTTPTTTVTVFVSSLSTSTSSVDVTSYTTTTPSPRSTYTVSSSISTSFVLPTTVTTTSWYSVAPRTITTHTVTRQTRYVAHFVNQHDAFRYHKHIIVCYLYSCYSAAPGPTVSGTTNQCYQWYTVQSGDTTKFNFIERDRHELKHLDDNKRSFGNYHPCVWRYSYVCRRRWQSIHSWGP